MPEPAARCRATAAATPATQLADHRIRGCRCGLPHPALGEEVGAAVALRPGAAVSAEELRGYVRSQVAADKYPRHVWIVDALPKRPTGKIQKQDIVPPADLAPR
jgi:long-chain acyl-CoA synthetase